MNTNDDETVARVFLMPRIQIWLSTDTVDTRVCPEIYQDDPATERLHSERTRINPSRYTSEFRGARHIHHEIAFFSFITFTIGTHVVHIVVIFEDDIIERIIDGKSIYKYISLDDKNFDFFDIACDDEKTNNKYNNSKSSAKYSVRITEKFEPTDDAPSKVNNQEEDNTKTNKICQEANHARSETCWKYRGEKNSVSGITAGENWTKCSAESYWSPDSFLMTRSLERVLGELFYAGDIHEPDPDTRKYECDRKEDEKSACHIFPKRWINTDEHGRSLEKNGEDEE